MADTVLWRPLPKQDDEDEDKLDPQLERQTAEHPGGQFGKHHFKVKVAVSVPPCYLALKFLEQQKNLTTFSFTGI